MGKPKSQKGSGAKKHGRNFRLTGQKFRTTGPVTRYRALHGIPAGSRKSNHQQGICPLHR